jgi:hypothetical protein
MQGNASGWKFLSNDEFGEMVKQLYIKVKTKYCDGIREFRECVGLLFRFSGMLRHADGQTDTDVSKR